MTRTTRPTVSLYSYPDPALAKKALSELLIAWATDAITGRPRYIGEIDEDHRGIKCGCICPSCQLPLTAVNAAKESFALRPHFRHPNGAQRDSCAILAARFAALNALVQAGVIDLPAKSFRGEALGLSGKTYTAWVKAPIQRIKINSASFHDQAFALLQLDDGSELRVLLTGDVTAQEGANEVRFIPTIRIDVPGQIAGLDQDSILERLKLLPDSLCWVRHRDEVRLQKDADQAALNEANNALDWLDPAVRNQFEHLSPDLLRETVLHQEVKRILSEAARLRVPEMNFLEVFRCPDNQSISAQYKRPSVVLHLSNTRIEARLGDLVPDVQTEVRVDKDQPSEALLIEVTVTNRIDDERRNKIRSLGVSTMEIDLSNVGGTLTKLGLQDLVLNEVVIKKWIAHPEFERLREEALKEKKRLWSIAQEKDLLRQKHYQRVMAEPLSEISERFLKGATELFELQAQYEYETAEIEKIDVAKKKLNGYVQEMIWRGFPEIERHEILDYRGIVARILSIKLDRGIGYRLNSGHQVLNAIKQIKSRDKNNLSLYFIAERVYQPAMTAAQRIDFNKWRDQIKQKIRANDESYLRDTEFDALLCVLFPSMAELLHKKGGKRIDKRDPSLENNWIDAPNWRSMYRDGNYRIYGVRVDWKRILTEGFNAIREGHLKVSHLMPKWSNEYNLNDENGTAILQALLREARLPF